LLGWEGNALHATMLQRVAIVRARAVRLAPLTGVSTLSALLIALVPEVVACLLVAPNAVSVYALARRAIRTVQALIDAAAVVTTVGTFPGGLGITGATAITLARRLEALARTRRICAMRLRPRENASIAGVAVAAGSARGVGRRGALGVVLGRQRSRGERQTATRMCRLIARFTGTLAGRVTAHTIDTRRTARALGARTALDADCYDRGALPAARVAKVSRLTRAARAACRGASGLQGALQMTRAAVLDGRDPARQLTTSARVGWVVAPMTHPTVRVAANTVRDVA